MYAEYFAGYNANQDWELSITFEPTEKEEYALLFQEIEEQVQQEASKAAETSGKAKRPRVRLRKQVLQRASKEAQGRNSNRRKQGR